MGEREREGESDEMREKMQQAQKEQQNNKEKCCPKKSKHSCIKIRGYSSNFICLILESLNIDSRTPRRAKYLLGIL